MLAFSGKSFHSYNLQAMNEPATLLLTLFYVAVLLLILIFDVRQHRILNLLALPALMVALLAGLARGRSDFLFAILGAAVGFLFFYALYWLGGKYYGPGALGFGDVKLAMLLGAMLGADQVLITLSLGMIVAGIVGLSLLFAGRAEKRSALPYGAFLAGAGIVTLVWIQMYPVL